MESLYKDSELGEVEDDYVSDEDAIQFPNLLNDGYDEEGWVVGYVVSGSESEEVNEVGPGLINGHSSTSALVFCKASV